MRHSALFGVVLVGACGGGHGGHGDHGNLPPAPAMLTPEPWDGALETSTITDENADPDVVEVTLTAAVAQAELLPGKPGPVWAYNGTVPGPTLQAKVGDRVIVHFTNDLPEATTIHWHGIRVPNGMDGTERVMDPIPAGGSFTYDFVALDAGTFWYHPHVRGDVQIEKGLYGAIVVADPAAPTLPSVVEEVVVLDDVLVDETSGSLRDFADERTEMMGLEGNLVLVNGSRSNLGVSVRAGERRRWHLVNAAVSRYFKLSLASGEMVRVGGDGGLLASSQPATELLLTPGERAEVLVHVTTPSTTATLRALPYERAVGAGATEAVDIVRLVAGADPAATPGDVPAVLRSIETTAATGPSRSVRLGEKMEGDRMIFTINDAVFPDVPRFTGTVGAVETWEVVNETEMDHPFHLHGFFFQREGVPEWKDTVNIPASSAVRLLVSLAARDGAAGGWMYHCHILGHQEGGMMGELEIE